MRSVLLAFAALAMAAQPCAAQTSEPSAITSPHERIYDTLIAQSDDGPVIEAMLDWLAKELARDPNVAAAEAANPGVIDQIRTATRPILARYSARVKLAYRPRMIAILEAGLTPAEAAEIAEFYDSPIGHRLVGGVSRSYRPDAVLETLDTDKAVTAADVRRDMDSASQAMLHELSADETAELYREVAARPAMARLVPVVPKLAALRAEMEEQPLTPEEEEAIQVAVSEVFASM